LLGASQMLDGPVGESNGYALHPRGRLLMLPATRAGLLEQMAAVLASGNDGVIEGMALPERLPPEIAARFFGASDGAVAAALVEGGPERIMEVAQEVAARDGAIIPVHAAREKPELAYAVEWLLEEVSTSINTTAAGGNASLMMLD
jgi:RHH-type transcriptional regulator, proline utilization regulon repressor / proline dehydrogenase / delta 1-pyrroline-5-carboxylate dehydrogenase